MCQTLKIISIYIIFYFLSNYRGYCAFIFILKPHYLSFAYNILACGYVHTIIVDNVGKFVDNLFSNGVELLIIL